MTQPIHLRENIFGIQVPEGAHHLLISGSFLHYCMPGMSVPNKGTAIALPAGVDWQIICLSKRVTQDQAKEIVEEFPLRSSVEFTRESMWQETAIESLHSLLRSKSLDINQTLIIEKL